MISNFANNEKFKIVFFYLFLFIFSFVAGLFEANIDYDLFSRLIMGHSVFNYGSVQFHDIVSYTPTHVWYDHEWLSSTLFYMVLKFFGLSGLYFLKTLLYFLTVSLIDFGIILKQDKFFYKYKSIFLFLVLALLFHVHFFHSLRCQNFSYIFILLLLIILERYSQNQNSKLVYFIPFLMLLWLNCHGGSMYGIGILGLYLIGQIINKKQTKKLIIVLIFSLLMYLINPWGIDFIWFMISAISVDRTNIGEWSSPFSMNIVNIVIYLLIQLFIVITYIYSQIRNKVNLKTLDYTKLLILLAFMIMSFRYIKHSFVYFVILPMFIYQDIKCVFDDILSKFRKTISINWVIIPMYLVFFGLILYNHNFDTLYENILSKYPFYPMQFLKDNNIKGRIFAPYYLGGYIAYKTYPDLQIYMDGRQEEVYSYDLFKKHTDFLLLNENGVERVLEEYIPDIILVERDLPCSYYLDNFQNYFQKVYQDSKYNIYLAKNKVLFSFVYPKRIPDFTKENFIKSNYFN